MVNWYDFAFVAFSIFLIIYGGDIVRKIAGRFVKDEIDFSRKSAIIDSAPMDSTVTPEMEGHRYLTRNKGKY